MTATRFYLPEHHNFVHIACAPWPLPQPQIDWVDQIHVMEYWLERYVGPHYTRWAWATEQDHKTYEACVAFKWAKHKTLFLLTYN